MKALMKYLDRTGEYHINQMVFYVMCTDAREVFGRQDVKIKPVAGKPDEKWVSLDSVNFN